MTFSRWYPLDDASTHTPARPGVLQLRVRDGLIDYPRGKSAMIHYAVADDLRRVATSLPARAAPVPILCRHTEELSAAERADLAGAFARLLATFRARFGAEPGLPPS
ncbi:MAG TPA: hypothetical protein VML75_08305 [Kofleriaceae bacterium]|nr:hypothetical protein [Kofleriaceae bacterium]